MYSISVDVAHFLTKFQFSKLSGDSFPTWRRSSPSASRMKNSTTVKIP